MAAEIERKFLPLKLPDAVKDLSATVIEQGYLVITDAVEVRLRRADRSPTLTVKRGSGEIREEVEIGLSEEHFELLWPLTEGRRLRKDRRVYPLEQGRAAEFDCYHGVLAGLVVAEVEFDSERESAEFLAPAWLGREVTGERRYSNQALAADGRPTEGSGGKREGGIQTAVSASYQLKRKESAAEGLRRVARGRAETARSRIERALGGEETAGSVHAARKDFKKLRSVLRLARGGLDDGAYSSENRRFRDAGRELAASRDAEVKLETLLSLVRHFSGELPAVALRRWESELRDECDADPGAADAELVRPMRLALATLAEAPEVIAGWQIKGEDWDLLGPGLKRSYGRGRKAMARALKSPNAENVHEWRKRSKDLWYQLRLLCRAWPALLEPTIEAAHQLADLLGDHHDLVVLAEDLGGRGAIDARETLEAAIESRQEELLEAAFELGARLYVEKPAAFTNRIKGYWGLWRGAPNAKRGRSA